MNQQQNAVVELPEVVWEYNGFGTEFATVNGVVIGHVRLCGRPDYDDGHEVVLYNSEGEKNSWTGKPDHAAIARVGPEQDKARLLEMVKEALASNTPSDVLTVMKRKRTDTQVTGQAEKIDGMDLISVNGRRYEWNESFSSYWSVDGDPRALQKADLVGADVRDGKVTEGNTDKTANQMGLDLGLTVEMDQQGRSLVQATAPLAVSVDTVEQETGLAVQVIVDVVSEEVAYIAERAGQPQDRCYAILQELRSVKAFDYVATRTCRLYTSKQGNRRLKSHDPRSYFYSFVRHWLSGYLRQVDHAAYTLLPDTFKVGQPMARC